MKRCTRQHGGRGFTLTELMIAIAVLIVVILATSRIFGTVTKVSGISGAVSDVMQEVSVIDSKLRSDFLRITGEGPLAIRCVAVRNNINQLTNPNAPLLNPSLPSTAYIRSDQMVFFTNGYQGMQTYRFGNAAQKLAQGVSSRVYFGHAYQLPRAAEFIPTGTNQGRGHDAASTMPMLPWNLGNVTMVRTFYSSVGQAPGMGTGVSIYQPIGGGSPSDPHPATIDGTQPEARQWLLARQEVALVDDDDNAPNVNSKTSYLSGGIAGQGSAGNTTARSVFLQDRTVVGVDGGRYLSLELRNGRMDGAATQLSDIRNTILRGQNIANQAASRTYHDQRAIILGHYQAPNSYINPSPVFAGGLPFLGGLLQYPRAERVAPSMHRIDQALTTSVIGTACSNVVIEWTYTHRVGEATNSMGFVYDGMVVVPGVEQPWFGIPDLSLTGDPDEMLDNPSLGRGSTTFTDWMGTMGPGLTVKPANIERRVPTSASPVLSIDDPFLISKIPVGGDPNAIIIYEAVFGYNQTEPLNPITDEPWPVDPPPLGSSPRSYTPFPSAIRVTLTLHDNATRLEGGREVQLIFDLPRRTR